MQHGVNKFAQNGAPQSRRQTEQWQMLDETIASASINEIRVLPQKHSPGVGGLSSAMVVVSRQSRALQACRIQQCALCSRCSPVRTAPVFFARNSDAQKRARRQEADHCDSFAHLGLLQAPLSALCLPRQASVS